MNTVTEKMNHIVNWLKNNRKITNPTKDGAAVANNRPVSGIIKDTIYLT